MRAYERVARMGRGALAQRARYLAATILQDRLGRCSRALVLLDHYLAAGGGPVRPEALVRKAQCLLRLGRKGEARGVLRSVTERYGGTTAALRARRLLESLGGDGG